MQTTTGAGPLVSVLVVCKDSARTIERCIGGLLAQDYPHLQIVVQDGASRDGTVERLRRYGDQLDLVSEPDRDQNEGFLKGLRRCRGEVIGFCWADEELLPYTAGLAVRALGARPNVSALYGDILETDISGRVVGRVDYPDWSFERVFTYEFIPPICATFLRRRALEDGFLRISHLAPDCTEYLLWVGVGSRFDVAHVAEPLARYARHGEQLSMSPSRVCSYVPRLVRAIARLGDEASMPDLVRRLGRRAMANVHLWAAQWLHEACQSPEDALRQLRESLAYDVDPAWLATVAWNCFRHSLARGEAEPVLDWLRVLREERIVCAGAYFARALACIQLGDPQGVAAAEEDLSGDPHLAPMLSLLPELVRVLERSGRRVNADSALAIVQRIAEKRSELRFRLSLALAEMGRVEEALPLAERHARLSPDHAAGCLWYYQLLVMRCARDPLSRRRLSGREGSELTLDQAAHVGSLVWRLVEEPGLAVRLSGQARPPLERMVVVLRQVAEERGSPELITLLRTVERDLRDVPSGMP